MQIVLSNNSIAYNHHLSTFLEDRVSDRRIEDAQFNPHLPQGEYQLL